MGPWIPSLSAVLRLPTVLDFDATDHGRPGPPDRGSRIVDLIRHILWGGHWGPRLAASSETQQRRAFSRFGCQKHRPAARPPEWEHHRRWWTSAISLTRKSRNISCLQCSGEGGPWPRS
jgi:hypothetical protein